MANVISNAKLTSIYPNKFNKRENSANIRNYTLALIDSALVISDEDGINFIRATATTSATLPDAIKNKGRCITMIVQDAGEILTITQNADGANIDGADANFALVSGIDDASIELYSTGTEWLIVTNTSAPGSVHTTDGVNLTPKLLRANFLFSDQPDTGALALFGATDIPDNAIITGGFVDVTTTFVGTGDDANTIAIHVNSADDIVAAVAISAATDWDAGLKDIVPDATGSTAVKLTAARDITVTVVDGAGVLSAGEFDVYLYYVIGS